MVTLEDVITDWQKRGIQVYITGANPLVIEGLEKIKLLPEVLKQEQLFDHFSDCIAQLPQLLESEPAASVKSGQQP